MSRLHKSIFFFFNDTATTEIYTLSLHDALPILPWATWARSARSRSKKATASSAPATSRAKAASSDNTRSEEHTSELQSRLHLVCRLLLEKKKNTTPRPTLPSNTPSAQSHTRSQV